MSLDDQLVRLLRCPDCRQTLTEESAGSSEGSLVCDGCGLRYPVRDGIPALLADEAERPG